MEFINCGVLRGRWNCSLAGTSGRLTSVHGSCWPDSHQRLHLSCSRRSHHIFLLHWDKFMAADRSAGSGDRGGIREIAGLGECRTSFAHPISTPIMIPMYHLPAISDQEPFMSSRMLAPPNPPFQPSTAPSVGQTFQARMRDSLACSKVCSDF